MSLAFTNVLQYPLKRKGALFLTFQNFITFGLELNSFLSTLNCLKEKDNFIFKFSNGFAGLLCSVGKFYLYITQLRIGRQTQSESPKSHKTNEGYLMSGGNSK